MSATIEKTITWDAWKFAQVLSDVDRISFIIDACREQLAADEARFKRFERDCKRRGETPSHESRELAHKQRRELREVITALEDRVYQLMD